MSKKHVVIILMLGLSVFVSAARTWDDGETWGGTSHLWVDPYNWVEGAIPVASDSCYIKDLAAGKDGPTINAVSGDSFARRLRFEPPAGQSTTMTITGGSLTIASWDTYISDILVSSDGGELLLPAGGGDNRLAKIAISGGALNAEFIRVGSGGNGQIDIFGGTVSADVFMLLDDGLVDIRNDGQLIINDTDDSNLASLGQYMVDGRLVAYEGRGLLDIQMDDVITISALAFPDSNDMAWNPSPSHYAANVLFNIDEEVVLNWNPGDSVPATGDAHKVYFGDSPTNLTLVSTQAKGAESYDTANLGYDLELDKTYYWRVDEVDPGNPDITGQVWQFTTNDYIIVDQFEDYADEAALDAAWVQSGGALTTLETTDPVRHTQSLKMFYDNTSSPYTSEATYTFTGDQGDLTRMDHKMIFLWFYGDAANDPNEPMYVKLSDGTNSASVTYGGLDYKGDAYDPADVADSAWHIWILSLQPFADGGVDLSSVQTMTIGLGGAGALTDVDYGNVWFDNIRLAPVQCWGDAPGLAGGDLNNDCTVNMSDFTIMAGNWLDTSGLWP